LWESIVNDFVRIDVVVDGINDDGACLEVVVNGAVSKEVLV
jgi:hypothetical protein